MKTSTPQSPQIEIIHGSRVLPIVPVTKAFIKALKNMASKGFTDPSCIIVKTERGEKSGVTHAGGRYIHPSVQYGLQVISIMKDQGIEPPPMPFVVASEAPMLYHEWGHHVDFCWSGNDHAAIFSNRWFSHFYEVVFSDSFRRFRERYDLSDDLDLSKPEITGDWFLFGSELFAYLFVDWMRGRVTLDWCEPKHMNDLIGGQFARAELLNGVTPTEVREKTYALFENGLKGPSQIPEVRPDLFGSGTSTAFGRLKEARDKECEKLRR